MSLSRVLVARQPVLDRALDVQAYRLVAQSTSVADALGDLDGSRSAAKVINDAFLEMDVWAITGGKPAHLPFPRDLLLHGTATLLPPSGTVLELPAETGVDDLLVETLRDLRGQGYRVALADVTLGDARVGALPADIAKVRAGTEAPRAVRSAGKHGLSVIIAGVADAGTYLSARDLGADGYEGPFLQSPGVVRGRRLEGSRIEYLRLLQAAQRPELDFEDLEERIKREVSLSWKFLNYANSAFFGWRARMTSIRQGLVLLGEAGVRRWVSLVAMSSLADGMPREVVTTAVTRARFAECVASRSPAEVPALQAFLVGMFSLLDTLIDEPMGDLLEQVAVPGPVARAILDGEGQLGVVLALVRDYEQGRFEDARAASAELGVDTADLFDCYVDALGWASQDGPTATPEPVGGP